jgi:N-acyl-D-aspartate/D-glutamate deacylase
MTFLTALCMVSMGAAVLPDDPRYDVVIRHGKIVDGTGNPWYHGDVAIRDRRIVAMGRVPPAPAKRTIDA